MTRHALFAMALLVAGCTGARDQPPPLAAAPAFAAAAPTSFAPLVKRVMPAVVNISILEGVSAAPDRRRRPFRPGRGRNPREAILGAGSGFIVDPSGIIVTNTHVVGQANQIGVTLADGREVAAKVIGSDDLTDLAVLRVESATPLPYVQWGDSKATEIGDWVLAAGNPFGVGSSMTAGIVSARGRDIGASPFDDFLQIDASINPGNSGGPTFNMAGQVIAVNTAIVSPTGGSVGIGFGVPSEIAETIVNDLRQKGRVDRGWLGVSVQDIPGRATEGVVISSVDRAGPAARAGLRPGDIVTAIGGARMTSAQNLIRAVTAVVPGAAIDLTVQRGEQAIQVPVTVGLRPTTQEG